MFSIIIPVHNKLPHLDRSIHSVLNQTFKDFELLIIDDASTDGSSEKIKEYSDPRIRTFRRDTPGPGGYAARNLGIKQAKYEWIAFLDADDEWDKDKLRITNQLILENPDIELFSSNWRTVTKCSTITEGLANPNKKFFSLLDYLNKTELVWTGVVTVHQNLVKRAGNFPNDKQCHRGGDVDTWVRWLYDSKKSLYLEKSLAYYYRGTVNQVTSKPNTYFCAYKTLIRIYKNCNNKDLRQAIRKFNNKFIYNMLARQIRSGMKVDYNGIRKMFFGKYKVLRILKLHLIKYKLIK